VGAYIARRLANYVVLLFIAVSLSYFLAATQLHPRQLYQLINPPLDPVSVESNLRSRNLSDQVPLLERYWVWL
jgi:peptide/nickel transport system permease protein